jgi:glycerate 2-kinase
MIKKTSPPPKSGNFITQANQIIRQTLKSVEPAHLVQTQIRIKSNQLIIKEKKFDLNRVDKIHVIGAGKAVSNLYLGIKKKFGPRIHGGIIISPNTGKVPDENVEFLAGNHPVPGKKSFNAGRRVVKYLSTRVGPDDLLLVLITGGASSMMCYPWPGLEPNDIIQLNKKLIASGASIREINCIRKHLSGLKGGRLAERVYPAHIITLILSDIIGSPLEDIGSGPSIGDSTTFDDAYAILEKYKLMRPLSPGLRDHFKKGRKNQIPETPSPGNSAFKNNLHFLLGDNSIFLRTARQYAESLGIKSIILTSRDRGEAREGARIFAAIMEEIVYQKQPFKPPVLILSGGELTVTLKGKGKGGRNQEFVLQMLKELKDIPNPFFVLSMGTDGIDGPTDAAGAWIDEKTMKNAKKYNLDINEYLKNNDSYAFFNRINRLVKTGPTNTNVMDFRMFYIP